MDHLIILPITAGLVRKCTIPECDQNAVLSNSTPPCGQCQCKHGWAGPGILCGEDKDADGWSDVPLNCTQVKFQILLQLC